jgi:hypothetical protein
MSEITKVEPLPMVTEFSEQFLREYEAEILGRVPKEKVEQQLRMEKNARIMAQAGSVMMEGLGQKIAQIPARIYFRMLHSMGKHEENWLDDLLRDNPVLCAPGYYPKRRKSDFRHGKTFVGGKPI